MMNVYQILSYLTVGYLFIGFLIGLAVVLKVDDFRRESFYRKFLFIFSTMSAWFPVLIIAIYKTYKERVTDADG